MLRDSPVICAYIDPVKPNLPAAFQPTFPTKDLPILASIAGANTADAAPPVATVATIAPAATPRSAKRLGAFSKVFSTMYLPKSVSDSMSSVVSTSAGLRAASYMLRMTPSSPHSFIASNPVMSPSNSPN